MELFDFAKATKNVQIDIINDIERIFFFVQDNNGYATVDYIIFKMAFVNGTATTIPKIICVFPNSENIEKFQKDCGELILRRDLYDYVILGKYGLKLAEVKCYTAGALTLVSDIGHLVYNNGTYAYVDDSQKIVIDSRDKIDLLTEAVTKKHSNMKQLFYDNLTEPSNMLNIRKFLINGFTYNLPNGGVLNDPCDSVESLFDKFCAIRTEANRKKGIQKLQDAVRILNDAIKLLK